MINIAAIDRHRVALSCALALFSGALLSQTGCGGRTEARLDDYLEELEFDTPLETVKEIPLGKFKIHAAVHQQDASQGSATPIWVQIRFSLYAVVAPNDESAVLRVMKRHQGTINDTVMGICRSSSLDDLDDPRLSTLKTRLTDDLRLVLGEKVLRQILADDYSLEAI